jgi:hypothetical protein
MRVEVKRQTICITHVAAGNGWIVLFDPATVCDELTRRLTNIGDEELEYWPVRLTGLDIENKAASFEANESFGPVNDGKPQDLFIESKRLDDYVARC